ncbi:hypothetical protein K466DRAFT_592938 [Polyporus arcularius HHB13444]|uniref:Uncharacterized protein n=1 Tax=Polyporus arcularius HHB13444 TaxID=1314778 RepID=A0A5C3NMR9_9APHY|nr:hypothetical protein K466DRAFT_592938 [Polyporus arcularius HHB13444]
MLEPASILPQPPPPEARVTLLQTCAYGATHRAPACQGRTSQVCMPRSMFCGGWTRWWDHTYQAYRGASCNGEQ